MQGKTNHENLQPKLISERLEGSLIPDPRWHIHMRPFPEERVSQIARDGFGEMMGIKKCFSPRGMFSVPLILYIAKHNLIGAQQHLPKGQHVLLVCKESPSTSVWLENVTVVTRP